MLFGKVKSLEFTIEVVPRGKKNNSRIVMAGGRRLIIPSKAYKEFEEQGKKYCPPIRIDFPVNVEAHYYVQDRRRRDLCNFHEALCDLLVAAETVVDDSVAVICSMDGSRIHLDREHPRIEVIITKGVNYDKSFEKS